MAEPIANQEIDNVIEIEEPVAVDDLANYSDIPDLKIAPNPSKNLINIQYQLKAASQVQIDLFDIHGILIKKINSPAFLQQGNYFRNIDLSELSAGVYFLRLTSNNHSVSQKIIKL